LFEFATAEMIYSEQARMAIADLSWSPDSKYLALTGSSCFSHLQMLGIDSRLYEKILSVHDIVAQNKDFWRTN
jgi:hypothetical protein